MDEIKIFNKDEFEIRTTNINGKPYFVANDIAKSLGYSNPSKATNDHCKNSVMGWGNDSLGRKQEFKFIPEGDVYRLIVRSKLPYAEKFELWVFDEVLPTIRNTGGYINNSDLMINTYFSDIPDERKIVIKGLLVDIEEKQKKIDSLIVENDLLAQKTREWKERPLINALVRAYAASIGGDFGKAWNSYKKELLYKYSINLNSRITNYLNTTGKKTKPKTLDMIDDSELANAVSTAVSLCKENDIDIDDILENIPKKTN